MKHNDPVKAGNIVYWDKDQKHPSVVVYITTPNWKDSPENKGKRYARVTHTDTFTIWVEVSKLAIAKDVRTHDRKKQLENLAEFEKEIYDKKYPQI